MFASHLDMQSNLHVIVNNIFYFQLTCVAVSVSFLYVVQHNCRSDLGL